MMEKWMAKELALSQRHEELVMRREAMLRGTEAYYYAQDTRAASFISDFTKAKERNEMLLRDMDSCREEIHRDLNDPGTPKFKTLKNNYWVMVKNVFPVWQEELREYERKERSRSSGARSPKGQRSVSPRSMSPRSLGQRSNQATPRSPTGTQTLQTPGSSQLNTHRSTVSHKSR